MSLKPGPPSSPAYLTVSFTMYIIHLSLGELCRQGVTSSPIVPPSSPIVPHIVPPIKIKISLKNYILIKIRGTRDPFFKKCSHLKKKHEAKK